MRDVTILAIISLYNAFVRRAPHQHDLFYIKIKTGCVMLRQYRDALRTFPIRQFLQNRITDPDIPGPRRKQTVNALQSVLFPHPFGPMMPVSCPLSKEIDTSFSTCFPHNRQRYD